MTRRDSACSLACELRRLWFDHRKPHVFDDAKRDLAARIAALGAVSPCVACEASRPVDATRQSARAAQARAEKAERLLASVRPARQRSRRRDDHPDLFAR